MHRHRDIETHRRREGDPGVTPSRGRRRPLSSTVLSSTPYISRPCITFSGVALPGPLQHTKSKFEGKKTLLKTSYLNQSTHMCIRVYQCASKVHQMCIKGASNVPQSTQMSIKTFHPRYPHSLSLSLTHTHHSSSSPVCLDFYRFFS